VRELLAHITVATGRVTGMPADPAPPAAEISAAGYYRVDARFSPETNAARVTLAQRAAGTAEDFDSAWRRAAAACESEGADRVVRTRHGDAMLLTDFLLTRIVELAVHGVDLSDALGREPWVTPEALAVLGEFWLGPRWRETVETLRWTPGDVLRKPTGRAPLTEEERGLVEGMAFG
jgi:hypothetical protein